MVSQTRNRQRIALHVPRGVPLHRPQKWNGGRIGLTAHPIAHLSCAKLPSRARPPVIGSWRVQQGNEAGWPDMTQENALWQRLSM